MSRQILSTLVFQKTGSSSMLWQALQSLCVSDLLVPGSVLLHGLLVSGHILLAADFHTFVLSFGMVRVRIETKKNNLTTRIVFISLFFNLIVTAFNPIAVDCLSHLLSHPHLIIMF